jgi:hypothetical protein
VGLISGLVLLPLAPVRGVAWIAEQVAEEAQRELCDERRVMEELAALEIAHEAGEIDEEQLTRGTDELLERLELGRRLAEGTA